jgi:hypothetical protein
LPANLHRLANKLYLVVFMTAHHHSIYCDLIHNEDATKSKQFRIFSVWLTVRPNTTVVI